MPRTYRVPTSSVRHEIDKVRGSRFIGTLAPVASPEEAMDLVRAVAAEFHDARHTCWGYRLGIEGETFRSSDDGEPSGSAGKPILAQLEGAELTQVAVAVTRYFGGTKLGVGGLVRAYGGATAAVIELADVQAVSITQPYEVTHPYSCSGAVEGLLSARGIATRDAQYGEVVRFTVDLDPDEADGILRELVERTAALATTRALPSPEPGAPA